MAATAFCGAGVVAAVSLADPRISKGHGAGLPSSLTLDPSRQSQSCIPALQTGPIPVGPAAQFWVRMYTVAKL